MIARTAAEEIFGLQEPWKDRFVAYIVERLDRNGHRPADASELAAWLAEDPSLAGMVALMVRIWSLEAEW